MRHTVWVNLIGLSAVAVVLAATPAPAAQVERAAHAHPACPPHFVRRIVREQGHRSGSGARAAVCVRIPQRQPPSPVPLPPGAVIPSA